eukprot:scaffold27116_cov51-Phaeocystis_antarctica.AAC.3
MVVTLDVSMLSGWSNADARCRESKAWHMMRDEVRAAGGGRREGRGERRAGEGSTADWGRGARGGAHVEHVAHVRDAGRVEAQRLVERRCALPRVGRRAHDAG